MTKIFLSLPIYLLRFMKWTFIILTFILTAMFSAKAGNSYGQNPLQTKVTVAIQRTTLKNALKILSQHARIDFAYNVKALPLEHMVELRATNLPVEQVLTRLITPLGLTYRVIGQSILIEKPVKKK